MAPGEGKQFTEPEAAPRGEGHRGGILAWHECCELSHLGGRECCSFPASVVAASLQRIYGERDLLVAECLRRGLWDGLDGPMLAAVLSTAIYEARRDDDVDMQRRIPKGDFLAITTEMEHVWDVINNAEADEHLEVTPPLAYGLALGIQRWAKGQRLDDVLRECNLAGGDFVRWAKQVIDSLDQIAHVAPPELAEVARAAIPTIRRGIVADSATL